MISAIRIQFVVVACCAIFAALGPERTDARARQVATSPANTESPARTKATPPPASEPQPPAATEAPPAATESPAAAASESGEPAPAGSPAPRAPGLNPALFKTPSPADAQLGELLDGPLDYFGDTTWNCETFAGSSETHAYERTDDGAGFVLHNVLRTSEGKTYRFDEKYAFARSRRVWTMHQGDGVYVATSVVSNHNYFIFEGNDFEHAVPTLVRMRYHMFDGVSFRRDFELLRAGHWVPYSGETCERSDSAGQQ